MHVTQYRAPATVNAGPVPSSRMPLVPSDGATTDDTVLANTGHPLQPAKLKDMQLRTEIPRNDELLKAQLRPEYLVRYKGQVMDHHCESTPLGKPQKELPEDHTELRQHTAQGRRATRRQRCDPGFLGSGAASQKGAIPPVPV